MTTYSQELLSKVAVQLGKLKDLIEDNETANYTTRRNNHAEIKKLLKKLDNSKIELKRLISKESAY